MPTPTGVHALVRRTHEDRILRALRERGALPRGEIARAVGLSRTTLSEITGSLLARGAIIVVDTDAAERNGSGRPAERLALDPRSGQFMGVDFGHRRVHISVADAAHEVIASGSERYAAEVRWSERLHIAFDLADRLAAETGVHFGDLQAIGIGIPNVTRNRGLTRTGEGGLRASDVEAAFERRYQASVLTDNNTRFAALAEAIDAFGAADDLIYVRLSDGVGGGLVVGGRLVAGNGGVAGELGHVRVERDGRPCRCGKDGCLETVASVPAILAECAAHGVPLADIEQLAAAAARNHPAVDKVLRDASGALARVLGAAMVALDPAQVVIGGDIVRAVPAIVPYVASALRYEVLGETDPDLLVRAARLGDDDGSLGAIAALFHRTPLLTGYPDGRSDDRDVEPRKAMA